MRSALPFVLLLAACNGDAGRDCSPSTQIDAWEDADGDGFGSGTSVKVCTLGAGQVDNAVDCDDTDPAIHPDAEELCNGLDDDCDGRLDQTFELVQYWQDGDGDGYGARFPSVVSCAAPEGAWVTNALDCDDTNGAVNPAGYEVCNGGIDDDCDGLSDDADDSTDEATKTKWFLDRDADGYGDPRDKVVSCAASAGRIPSGGDCDDANSTINPLATEICNDQVDDDCDQLADGADPSLDPTTSRALFRDADGDGYGDPNNVVQACNPFPGGAMDNDLDCDDTRADVNPDATELLCDTLDNDCDASTPDDVDRDADGATFCVDDCADTDPTRFPGATELPDDRVDQDCDGLEACYQDVDGDGLRTDVWVEVADPNCRNAPNVSNDLLVDCDDTDASLDFTGWWFEDRDLDGVPAGAPVLYLCGDPGTGLVAEPAVPDCDDRDDTVYPGALDVCLDGVDSDCDGLDCAGTCKDLNVSGTLPSGVYPVDPSGTGSVDVYCDLDTDGGGWTLVASTNGTTLDDAAGPWNGQLTTLNPTAGVSTVWNGMRAVIPDRSDIRFACKNNVGAPNFTVDLSFYDTIWYREITTGTDTQSCFSENNGAGADPPPARRNNLTGATLPAGDNWNAGYLEGEDSCSDSGDFTVDFDDRGMDSNQADGTDWGEDDSSAKCGSTTGGAWFIFVREP